MSCRAKRHCTSRSHARGVIFKCNLNCRSSCRRESEQTEANFAALKWDLIAFASQSWIFPSCLFMQCSIPMPEVLRFNTTSGKPYRSTSERRTQAQFFGYITNKGHAHAHCKHQGRSLPLYSDPSQRQRPRRGYEHEGTKREAVRCAV